MILTFLAILAAGPPGSFDVSAHIPAEKLALETEYHFIVEVEADGEIDANFNPRNKPAPGSLRKPILQLDVPPSVQILDSYKPKDERKGAEDWLEFYFKKPYGRLIKQKSTQIPFKLVADPKPGETLGINVMTYLNGDEAKDRRFIRRRIDLPLKPGARLTGKDAQASSWGLDKKLGIGDKAPAFKLPAGDGTDLDMTAYLGKQPVFIQTYRADW
ncbi:MAG: hypothetical protein QNK37_30345 [Acidobacteriota bacterium]|nr:hypothetical protein [Acidobacteriota bacterium]